MAAPGALDPQDQGGEGDDFTDEEAGSDDLADDVTVVASETVERIESTFEPSPSPPEEPVHIAHSEVEDAPAPPEVEPASEPAVTSEPSDPFAREQS